MVVPTWRSTRWAGAPRSRRRACRASRGLPRRAEVGRAEVIPPGLPPGSDVGNMAILGFDPARYHTGRAPIEAAAMGVELGPDEVAYRCNLVTVSDDDPALMVDFAAGHISSEQSHPIVAALDADTGQRPRRRALPPWGRVPPPLRRSERLGRRGVHAAARSHGDAGRVPHRAVGSEGASAHGRVARSGPRRRGRRRLLGNADLVVGPGREARASRSSTRRTASPVGCRRPSIWCKAWAC